MIKSNPAEHPDVETLKMFRWLIIVGSFCYGGWTLVYRAMGVPDDSFSRALVAAGIFSLVGLTFARGFKTVHLHHLILAATSTVMIHSVYAVYLSQYHPAHMNGIFLALLMAASIYDSFRHFLFFAAINALLTSIVLSTGLSDARINFASGNMVILCVMGIVTYSRARLLEKLRERDRRFSRFSSGSQEAIFFIDRGRIIDMNPAAERLCNFGNSELLGESLGICLVRENHEPVEWDSLSLLENPSVLNEGLVLKKNGSVVPAEFFVEQIDFNNQVHTVVVVRDISIRKDYERQITEHQQKLAFSHKMSALGEMAAGIAHEINNPLSIISGRTWEIGALVKKNDLEKISDKLKSIDKTVGRITKIVAGLRAFAHGGRSGKMERTTVRAIVEDALSFCESRLASAGINLKRENLDIEVALVCRPTEIMQVLVNLLNNSVDAFQQAVADHASGKLQRAPVPEITIILEADVKGTILHVEDGGPGISQDAVAKIFTPYFTTKATGVGTGMGLALSMRILKDHDASISLTKNSESGVRFSISFPDAPDLSVESDMATPAIGA